jgi:hypothetical protein
MLKWSYPDSRGIDRHAPSGDVGRRVKEVWAELVASTVNGAEVAVIKQG